MLERLRAIGADLGDVEEGVRILQVRVTSIEENMAAMNRPMDRMERDIGRIKRRLDLVEAQARRVRPPHSASSATSRSGKSGLSRATAPEGKNSEAAARSTLAVLIRRSPEQRNYRRGGPKGKRHTGPRGCRCAILASKFPKTYSYSQWTRTKDVGLAKPSALILS